MVLPRAIDTKILLRESLALEAGFLQQPDRGDIGRDARSFDAVKLKRSERKWDDRSHSGRHIALPGIRRANPITQTTGLSAATPDICQGQPADERVVGLAEHKEGISQIGALILGISLNAAAERRVSEIIGRPGRL